MGDLYQDPAAEEYVEVRRVVSWDSPAGDWTTWWRLLLCLGKLGSFEDRIYYSSHDSAAADAKELAERLGIETVRDAGAGEAVLIVEAQTEGPSREDLDGADLLKDGG